MNDSDSLSLTPNLARDLSAEAAAQRLAPDSAAAPSTAAPPRADLPQPEPRRAFAPLGARLADQGLFLFRRRSLFAVFLLPPAVLAVLERRSAAPPADPGLGWLAVCLAVSLLGMAARAAAVGSAPPGASTRSLRAPSASRLNVSGMYSLCRHPVYLGNFFVLLGFALALQSWWFTLSAALIYWLLYERVIAAEERFLDQRFGGVHRRWSARTPTFWPRPRLWRPPERRFCWRAVLLREYNSLLLISATFTFLRWVDQSIVRGLDAAAWLRQDLGLVASVLALAIVVAVMRRVRKRGRSGH